MVGSSFAFSQLQALLIAVDTDGRVLSSSDALIALLGCDGKEIAGHLLDDLADSGDAQEIGRSLGRAFSSQESVSFTTRFMTADRRSVTIEWRGRTEISDGEPVLALLGHDVTALHDRIDLLELLASELHCIRKLNHLISRERDPQRLIDNCCEILVSSGCLASCFILLVKDGEISLCAGSGEPGMVDTLHRMVEQRKPPRCLMQMPGHPDTPPPEDMPELCNDCPALMYFTPQATLSVMIESDGIIHGRLKAAFPAGVVIDSERTALLNEVADDLAFALQSIELEKERDRRTEELRVARDRMAAILNTSPAAVLSMTPDGRVTSWNSAAEEIFGWKAEEVIGEYLPFVPPEKRQEFDALRGRVISGNALKAHELVRVRKDGRPVIIQVSNAPVRAPGGEIEGIISVVMDITDQAGMREKLGLSEELFRAAFDNASIGRSLTSIDGRLLRVNGMMCHQLGYSAEELLTMTIKDITHPDDCIRSFDAVKSLLSNEVATIRFEKRYIRKDGTVFWAELHTKLLRDKDDRPLHFITDILDITEHHMALERLGEERARLRQILDSYPHGVYMVNSSFDIQYINPYLEKAFGPVGGRKCFEFFHDLSSQCPWCVNDRVMKGESVRWEWASPKNGRIYDLFDAPFVNSDGTVSKLEFFNDITEHRRTEEQLRFSQKMEAVGRLAGGIAHDFNNLLTVINGYSEIAAERLGQNDPVRADIIEVLRAGEQAASLTRQLLAFSSRQVFKQQVLDISRTVGEMKKMLSRILGEDVTLEVRLAEAPGNVIADPGQVEQILLNLVVNARDAMPHGGVLTIETSTVHLDSDYVDRHADIREGRYVLLAVSDTGHGIDRETASKIFEPFFTTKELGKGTGLGLATVYGIVKQSGGDIAVYSEPGFGTTFKVFLPCTDASVNESKAPPDEQKASGNETVLLVEDDESVRRLAEHILKDAGYNVLTAAEGSEAMEIFEKQGSGVDLLLTDVVMPRMSGRELAVSLIQQKPGLRILCMSGYTDNAIVHHGILDPGISFIDKPFSAGDLIRKIRDVLAREPEERE